MGTSLLTVAIFFWTQKYLGWSLKENFLLAAGQGGFYVFGALAAQKLADRFGHRRALIGIYLILMCLTLLAATAPPVGMVTLLLSYSLVAGTNWPMLESLVTSGTDANTISRRVSFYNLVWSGSNSVALAFSGLVIESVRSGIFLVAGVANLACAIALLTQSRVKQQKEGAHEVHAEPEPELVASRTLAMWLARIALPSTYVVIYSMMAMMPSLPVMQELSTAQSTLVSSVWMAARFLTFLGLGFTIWWHTRPRLLLLAAIMMLLAFLGVTVPPSGLGMGGGAELLWMILWQLVLGLALGTIYAASLYFGMVLSQGSTEHGGYHEALIGLGSVLGPGAGALTQAMGAAGGAGKTPYVAIFAVTAVIAASVGAAAVATVRLGRRASHRQAAVSV